MNKVLYIMDGVPKRCVLHPEESIGANGLCKKCTVMGIEVLGRVKKGPKFTRSEKAIYIHDINESLITMMDKAVLIEMILMDPYEETRCHECATPLNEEGYCDACIKHYQDVKLEDINDIEKLMALYEEFLDACVPEFMKWTFMDAYRKKKIVPTICGFCGNSLSGKDAWCQECLKKVDYFWEKEGYKWPQITLQELRAILFFTRMASIPMELRIELLREALGHKDLKERDLNPTVFWNTVKEKVKYLELNC